MREFNLQRVRPSSQDAPDALRRWTAAQRALRLENKLDDVVRVGRDLTTALARIASALERRAS